MRGRDGERSEREGGAFHVKPHWRCRGLRPTGSCAARPQEARSDIWRVRRGSILAQQRIKRSAASADVRFSNVEADAGKAVREQPPAPDRSPLRSPSFLFVHPLVERGTLHVKRSDYRGMHWDGASFRIRCRSARDRALLAVYAGGWAAMPVGLSAFSMCRNVAWVVVLLGDGAKRRSFCAFFLSHRDSPEASGFPSSFPARLNGCA